LLFKYHRHRLKRLLHLRFKQLVDTALLRILALGGVPLHYHLPALGLCQEGEVGQALRGIRHDAPEQALEMLP